MKELLTAGALVAAFSTPAMACENKNENRMTSERAAVLSQVDELNLTPTGVYLRGNDIGKFAEVSKARCNNDVFEGDIYVGQTAFVLNQPFPEDNDFTDEEYTESVDQFATNLANHICVLGETDPETSQDRIARDAAIGLMSMKAHIEAKYELVDKLVKPLEQLKEGDISVCGEVKQRYQTLGLQ